VQVRPRWGSRRCRFTWAGVASRGESALPGSPARSELLSRRSVAPVVADKEGFIVDPEVAESSTCRFDPAGGLGGADSRGLGWPAGVNLRCSRAQPGRSCSAGGSRSPGSPIRRVSSWTPRSRSPRRAGSTRWGSRRCGFRWAGVASRGESALPGSPARSKLLSRRLVAPWSLIRRVSSWTPGSRSPRRAGSTPVGVSEVPIHVGWGGQPG